MRTELLLESISNDALQLWRIWVPYSSYPSFSIFDKDGLVEDFPAFNNPNNGDQAIAKFRELRKERNG